MKTDIFILLFLVTSWSSLVLGLEPKGLLASKQVLIAAHRGGYESEFADKIPENSVANVANAIGKGFHVFETDLRVTKDGVFVIVHDGEISLETTGKGAAESFTWAELKLLNKRYRNRSGGDVKRQTPGAVSEHRIATFEEILQQANRKIMLKVDLKDDAWQHFPMIMELVAKHGMIDHTIFRVKYSQKAYFANYIKTDSPFSKFTLMFKVKTEAQVNQVKEVFDPATIEVIMVGKEPSAEELRLVEYANRHGLLVEQHSAKNQMLWAKQVAAGVRMFHTAAPTKLKEFLQR